MIQRLLSLTLCLATPVACVAQTTPKEARHRADLGVKAMQQWYDPGMGLYKTTGWWNSANAITTLTDYMRLSHSKKHVGILSNTYTQAQITIPKEQRTDPKKELTGFPGFLNKYYDDEGWWALAWIDAYDLTHDVRYLTMARSIFDDMAAAWDPTCGGGIWWSKDRKYKNAIANELFFSVAAHLANRASAADREKFADWTAKEWKWFRGTGMINDDHLVNDGLNIDKTTGACTNNGRTVWTYNQGVLLGALAEWSKSTKDPVLEEAKPIVAATLTHLVNNDGIIQEPCEPKCGPDGVQFKGILMRNLRDLNAVAPDPLYGKSLAVNADAIWEKDRTPENAFGLVWSGPPGTPDAATHSSALDAVVAVISTKK